MDNEQIAFALILHSGNARSLAHEAVSATKTGNQTEARQKLDEAKKELIEAQKMHASFLRDMACGAEMPVDLLLVHAEDHVSGSQLFCEMAQEVVDIYDNFGGQHA